MYTTLLISRGALDLDDTQAAKEAQDTFRALRSDHQRSNGGRRADAAQEVQRDIKLHRIAAWCGIQEHSHGRVAEQDPGPEGGAFQEQRFL